MSLVVNTNIASMNAQRSLHASSKELATAMERLSTGKKINSAADDAAGFAIAESMTAQVRGLNMAVKNANDGLSLAAVVENASNDVTDMLQRIRELAVQAVSDTNSNSDRANLNNEARALINEINRVADSTQYNGEYVLNGSYQNKEIQVGYNDGDVINLSVDSIHSSQIGKVDLDSLPVSSAYDTVSLDQSMRFDPGSHNTPTYAANTDDYNGDGTIDTEFLGLGPDFDDALRSAISGDPSNWSEWENNGTQAPFGSISLSFSDGSHAEVLSFDGGAGLWVSGEIADGLEITSVNRNLALDSIDLELNPSDALNVISLAIEQVGAAKAELGAFQNRLEYTVANLMNVAEFTSAARSRIQDADFAQEAANLAKAQVLQQAGAAMLAQANAAPQLALSLLRS